MVPRRIRSRQLVQFYDKVFLEWTVQIRECGLQLRRAMDDVERQYISEALDRTSGNRTEAASLLGLNRTTLVEKIRKHNV